MSDSKDWRQGYQVDTEALADDLEQLAEGIRERDIGNIRIDSQTTAEADGMASREVTLEFVFTDGYDDCLTVKFAE